MWSDAEMERWLVIFGLEHLEGLKKGRGFNALKAQDLPSSEHKFLLFFLNYRPSRVMLLHQ